MDEHDLADFKRQNEQHAVRLLKERMHVLKSRAIGALPVPLANSLKAARQPEREVEPERSSSSDSGREYGEPPPQSAPPVLGIGTGSLPLATDYLHADHAPVVADSPTAVDFNVYDRAYEEEIERIKQTDGRPSVYMTWHLAAKDKIRGQEGEALDLLEDRQDEELAGGECAKDKLKDIFKPDRFADFVSQTIKSTKEKMNRKDEER